MEIALVIAAKNGQVQITGPLADIPLCLDLLAEGHKALANLMRQKRETAEVAAKKTLFLPDGSIAPTSSAN